MKNISEIFLIGDNDELYNLILEQIGELYQIRKIHPTETKKHTIQIGILLKTENESPLDMAQYIYTEQPGSSLIFINDMQDFELLRDLMKIGVSDYYVLPEEKSLLVERINEVIEIRLSGDEIAGTIESFKRGTGKVFTFYSGKGGAGKSFVSTAFAQTLKLESTAKVLYIDLNLQYGGAETFLGVDSDRTIIDLFPVIHELNEHHIRNVATKESHSELDVLVSPRDAEMAEKIDEDFVYRLISASKRSYDFIVIDVPSWMEAKTFTALEEAERIYYVMNLDTIAIRVLKSVENLFQQLGLVTDERMELVMNFTGKDNELTKKDIERFVVYPTAAELRRDLKGVQSLMNLGEPLRKEAKEKKLIPVAKDIQKWVRSMLK